MKRSICFVLLALFLFSCTSDVQDTLTDNRDALIDQLAQSQEYHEYFIAVRETEAEEEADPLDKAKVDALLEEGIDFRTLAEEELAHIPGATTYMNVRYRLMKVTKALNARFPAYPKQMSFEDRGEMLKRYMAFRGFTPMDFISPDQLSHNQ